jgi:hypothetical protein
MGTTERLIFSGFRIGFLGAVVVVHALPHEGAKVDAFYMHVSRQCLDWRVTCSMTQIFDTLDFAFSSIERLYVRSRERESSPEEDNDVDVDPTQWRILPGSFSNVEALLIDDGLILSLSLQSRDDGEPPLDLLPQLKNLKLVYSASGDVDDDSFTSFIYTL